MLNLRTRTTRPRPARTLPLACLALLLTLILTTACSGTPSTTLAPPPPTETAVPAPTDAPAPTATATRPAVPTPRPSPTKAPTRAVAPATAGAANTVPAVPITAPAFTRAGLKGQPVTALAADAKDGQILYAAGKGVSRSTDGGKTWTVVRTEKAAPSVAAIAIAPSDPKVVYIGVSEGCAKGIPHPGFVSTDGGATWKETGQSISAIVIDPKNAQKAYAADCNGLEQTTNGGTTWTVVDQTLAGSSGLLVAVAPAAPQTIYFVGASEGGTIKMRSTTDGGTTWEDISPKGNLTGPLALAVDRDKPEIVFLSTHNGLQRSVDGGKTWQLLNDGGLEAAIAGSSPDGDTGSYLTNVIVADPEQAGLFWVGTGVGETKGVGVFRTRNGGDTWKHAGNGIDGLVVQALVLGGAGNSRVLYVATDDGIWALTPP